MEQITILAIFCGDNDSYVHVGLYILVELPLLDTFVGGSKSSRVRKFQGAKVVLGAKSPVTIWNICCDVACRVFSDCIKRARSQTKTGLQSMIKIGGTFCLVADINTINTETMNTRIW